MVEVDDYSSPLVDQQEFDGDPWVRTVATKLKAVVGIGTTLEALEHGAWQRLPSMRRARDCFVMVALPRLFSTQSRGAERTYHNKDDPPVGMCNRL